MTGLELAKRFVQKGAAKTALVIVPLAIASTATASPIFIESSANANFTVSPLPNAIVQAYDFDPLPDGGIQFDGSFTFDARYTTIVSGGTTKPVPVHIVLTLFGEADELELVPGSLTGHYDFTHLFAGLTLSGFTASITFTVNGAPIAVSGLTPSSSGFVNLPFPLPVSDPGDPDTWQVVLDISGTPLPGDNGVITLNVADISIAVPAALDEVPEPASLLLLGSGLGAVVARRRFRQRTH